ncbi:MAG: helix-hairpin-helix domain-containing protein [Tissierellia bacterium]|nr:helix-hairpin-helix domain-containing protein [Tissierellia bacterium]
MDQFSPREKKILGGLLVLAMVGASFFLGQSARNQEAPKDLLSLAAQEDPQGTLLVEEGVQEEGPQTVFVHISGAVESPGLLELPQGSRLADGIEACGGALEEADLDRVNLAQVLLDEERIHIPRQGEDLQKLPQMVEGTSPGGQALVSLNRGTKEELMTLPGIGDKTADKIIDYRSRQPFRALEDLQEVPGIGQKTFEDLADKIRL